MEIGLNIVFVYTALAAVGAVIIFFILLQSEDKIFTNAAGSIKRARANWKTLDKSTKLKILFMVIVLFAVATGVSVLIYQYKKPLCVDEDFQAYNFKVVNGEELKAYDKLTCDVSVEAELERQWSGDYEAYGTISIGDVTYIETSGSVHPCLGNEDSYYVLFTLFSPDSIGGFAHVDMLIEMTENGFEIVSASIESGDAYDSEYVGPAESLEEAKAIYNSNK